MQIFNFMATAFQLYNIISLEIQNDFDEMLTISNKASCGKSTVEFDPPGDQNVSDLLMEERQICQ